VQPHRSLPFAPTLTPLLSLTADAPCIGPPFMFFAMVLGSTVAISYVFDSHGTRPMPPWAR
jgi:hypothetical protein